MPGRGRRSRRGFRRDVPFAAASSPLAAGTASATGETSTTISLSATAATGGTPGYSYQWQISTDGGSTWSNCAGTGVTTLTATASGLAPSTSYLFRIRVTDSAGPPAVAYSNSASGTTSAGGGGSGGGLAYFTPGSECCDCGGTQRLCVSVVGCCFAIPGVGLRLRDSGGASLATGTTDSSGSYCFDGLADGDYTVEITGGLPALYEIDAAEPDPQSVTVSGGSASLTYMVFCDASTGYGVGGGSGTPSRRFAAIRPVAGYWCAGCTLGIPPFGQPNVQCGDPAPYPVTLTFGGHTATLGDSGCAGYACKLWMGAFTWTGTGLGLLNPAFDPTLPVTLGNQPCPISGYGGPYDVLNSTFFCLADKTGLLICGPSCTGTGYDPAYGTDIQPAADVAGMTLCNAWNAIGYPYRTPVGTSTTSGGIASFYIPWRTADCSCSPLLLAGSWTPPVSYRPFWGSSPVTVSLAP